MALTVSVADTFHAGDREVKFVDITFDSTYPDNGESLTYTDLGFQSQVDAVIPCGLFHTADWATAVAISYDRTAAKLLIWVGDADAQDPLVQNTTDDMDAYSGRVLAIGQ